MLARPLSFHKARGSVARLSSVLLAPPEMFFDEYKVGPGSTYLNGVIKPLYHT